MSPEDEGMSIEICRDKVNVNTTLSIFVHNFWFVLIDTINNCILNCSSHSLHVSAGNCGHYGVVLQI
jgi:hypothetical protein